MAKHRIRKYSRRTRSQYKKSKAPVILSIIAFLLLSVIFSVVLGIMLSRRVDESGTPSKRFDFEKAEYDSNGKKVSALEAYHFPNGANAADYASQGVGDFSVCILHRDGTLFYRFNAGESYKADKLVGEMSFSELCSTIHANSGRVCAYVYIGSFNINNEYLRGIEKAYELALINEAARSGADDILLLGMNVTEKNIDEAEDFVARASIAAEKTPLGVAVDEKTLALTENEMYLAGRLRESCDYLALDLTELKLSDGDSRTDATGEGIPSRLETTLEKNEYYIKGYQMRILFSSEHSRLYIPALELGVADLQIVGE